MGKRRRLTVIGLAALGAIMLLAGAAIAVDAFPDVPADHPHHEGVSWAAEAGIVQGYENGNFGPYDNVLRGQAATMFMRYEDYRMEPVAANRGCASCHQGPFVLENEVPEAHPTVNGSQAPPTDTVDANDCLTCHLGDDTGIAPPLREIVHPVHMYSKIFAWEFMGNCFSCHANDENGQFRLLINAIAADDHGIPDTIPITAPDSQDIPGPPTNGM